MLAIFYKNKKGQVAPFLVLVLAVLLLAIAATMVVGEVAFNRVRLANVGDSAVISAASDLCRSLNYIKTISFGPGGMLITYVGLQSYLLIGAPGTNCGGCDNELPFAWVYKAQPLASGFFINSMLTGKRLYEEAQRTARGAAKDLRIKLYDLAFGGGLIDEPKPFINLPGDSATSPSSLDEVNGGYDGVRPSIPDEGFQKYLNRETRFTLSFRAFKRAHQEGDQAWYKNDLLFYSFNKSKDKVYAGLDSFGLPIAPADLIRTAEPAMDPEDPYFCGTDDEACLRARLVTVPNNISVSAQTMILVYLWGKAIPTYPPGTCVCIPLPGFIPDPWAWISKINLDSSSFGISLKVGNSFSSLPFFGSKPKQRGQACDPQNNPQSCEYLRPTLEHTGKVKVQGSVWSGYEPKMEQ